MALTVFSITVIVLLSGTFFVVAAVHVCPSGYTLYSDICYRIDERSRNWEDARTQCKAEQTDLISIHSECAFQHLKEKAAKYGHLWVGFRQYSKGGAYSWVDGNGQLRTDSPWWVPGEPNDDRGNNWEPCGQFWRRYPTNALNDDRWMPLPNASSDCPDVSTNGPFTTPTTQPTVPSTTKTAAVQSTTKATAGYSTTNTTSIPSSSSIETSIVPPPSTTETTRVPSLSTTKTTLVPYPSTTETTRVHSPSTTLSTEIPSPSATKTTKSPTTTKTSKVPTTTQTTKVPTTTQTPMISSTTNTATVFSTPASPTGPLHSAPTSPGILFTIVGIVLAVFVLCVGGIVFVIIRTRASARARVSYSDIHGLVQPPAETVKKHVFSVHTLHDKLNSY